MLTAFKGDHNLAQALLIHLRCCKIRWVIQCLALSLLRPSRDLEMPGTSSMYYKLACQDLHTNVPRLPFYSQLDNMSQSGFKPGQNVNCVNTQPFDLRQMSNALPEQSSFEARRPSAQFNLPPSAGMMNHSIPHMPQYNQQPHDPRNFARPPQHQHFAPPNMMHQAPQYQYQNRPQLPHMQTQPHLARVDPYAYGMVQQGYSPVDMRFPQQPFPIGYGPPAGYADPSKIQQRKGTLDSR